MILLVCAGDIYRELMLLAHVGLEATAKTNSEWTATLLIPMHRKGFAHILVRSVEIEARVFPFFAKFLILTGNT